MRDGEPRARGGIRLHREDLLVKLGTITRFMNEELSIVHVSRYRMFIQTERIPRRRLVHSLDVFHASAKAVKKFWAFLPGAPDSTNPRVFLPALRRGDLPHSN